MLAVSALNTITSLISKALSDDSISDDEYSLYWSLKRSRERKKTLEQDLRRALKTPVI